MKFGSAAGRFRPVPIMTEAEALMGGRSWHSGEKNRKWEYAIVSIATIDYRLNRLVLVGARGFEPPTPASRTQCATGLRYAPTVCPVEAEQLSYISGLKRKP